MMMTMMMMMCNGLDERVLGGVEMGGWMDG